MKIVLIVAGALALLGVAGMLVFVFVVQNVETPDYVVVEQDGAFELRDYPAMVVAEVQREGSRQQGLSAGFGPLARYIFAKERGGERVAMTAPVEQQQQGGERIAMTAPVEQQRSTDRIAMTAPVEQQRATDRIAMTAPVEQQQQPAGTEDGDPGSGADTWAVRFIMPSEYRLADLPAPAGNELQLREIPARRVAAVRFSGRTNDALIAEQERALCDWLAARDLRALSTPVYAYYNDPFTPGFLRRNEVMIDVPRS